MPPRKKKKATPPKSNQGYRYIPLQYFELEFLADKIRTYYNTIGLTGIAENLDVFYEKNVAPTLIRHEAQFVIAVDKDCTKSVPDLLPTDCKGFIYYYIVDSFSNKSKTDIKALYLDSIYTVKSPMPKLLVGLIKQAIEWAKRYKIQAVDCEGRTREIIKLWKHLGFKDVAMALRFEGGAEEFVKANPVFK